MTPVPFPTRSSSSPGDREGRVRLLWPVLVVCMAVGAGIGGAVPADAGQPGSDPVVDQQEAVDADTVRIDVSLRSDGSAAVTIEHRVELDDEERTEAFESLRADIEDDPETHTREFADRIDETVRAASDATGREMAADEFRVGAERQSLAGEYGVVRYSFHWHGFARTEGDELHAGDAIEGIYLDEDTRLLVGWPDGYEPVSVAPDPDDDRERAVIWYGGETEFVSGEPRVVVSPTGSGLGWGALAGSLAALAVIGGVAVRWFRRRSPGSARPTDEGEPTTSETPGSSGREPEIDRSLLSNEEQVLRLLEAHGGRVKQKTVVEKLDWTDAKTSKVVSALREEGTVESFRIGRENVLTLPEDDT